jgi:hypothetical protein
MSKIAILSEISTHLLALTAVLRELQPVSGAGRIAFPGEILSYEASPAVCVNSDRFRGISLPSPL